MIELENVSKHYDASTTFSVQNVSLHIAEGEFLVLLGSSGCGKTTLLRMLNRLEEPSEGSIRIHGQNIRQLDAVTLRRKIGFVFQDSGLFEHLTIAENITIVLRLEKVPAAKRRDIALQLMTFVDLDHALADKYPDQLSGGQQQRVGVARALANQPNILLMDEPFSAIDPITRDALQADLLKLKKTLKITVVFVTHDVFEALRLADRIAIMQAGELIQVGTPDDIIQHPANDFVADLFSKPMQRAALYDESL